MLLKKISFILIFIMVIGTIYFGIFQYDSSRILTYLAVIPVLGVPLLLKRTRYKLDDNEMLCYYLFVFMADFLGCVINLYNITWWYDIVVHFCSGIFTFLVGLFLLNKFNIMESDIKFRLLFSFCVVITVAGLWELFEFLSDVILGMDLQHNIETGVNDTMIDMLSASCGGIVSMVAYKILKK